MSIYRCIKQNPAADTRDRLVKTISEGTLSKKVQWLNETLLDTDRPGASLSVCRLCLVLFAVAY